MGKARILKVLDSYNAETQTGTLTEYRVVGCKVTLLRTRAAEDWEVVLLVDNMREREMLAEARRKAQEEKEHAARFAAPKIDHRLENRLSGLKVKGTIEVPQK